MVYICKLSPEIQKIAKEELNEDPERRQSDIDHIREWLKKQPHINAKTDDEWILLFLRGCKFSLQRTKEKLEMHYTFKGLVPEWYTNFNCKDPQVRRVLELGEILILPKYDPLGRKVIISRSGLHDPKEIPVDTVMRTTNMVGTILQKLEGMQMSVTGVVQIIDFQGLTMSHALQFTPSMMKKAMTIWQDGNPYRLKGVHYVHAGEIFTYFAYVEKLMKKKMLKRMHIHGSDLTPLYEHIPKDILPAEYGGTDGTIKDIIDYWIQKVDENEDYLQEEEKYTVDESKRLGKPKTTLDVFGIDGSFRKLNIE